MPYKVLKTRLYFDQNQHGFELSLMCASKSLYNQALYNNLSFCSVKNKELNLALSIIRQDKQLIGETAAKELIKLINDKHEKSQKSLNYQLLLLKVHLLK